MRSSSSNGPSRRPSDATAEAREVAEAAKLAHARGKVELVQGPDTDGLLSYFAIRRKRVEVRQVNGSKWLPYISQEAVIARKWG
jgi:hypothetical protein